eukprot:gnl/TRDRNA2_/TRDRNA2_189751_c0_seq1.p1 gnl/TRDRNA2_/TRDRNA2_189751_c0~~gnl/TRDRNA2_/TRDRNA2_189751_c0_seq1.p1  ORF type:complete len:193 (-),score=21.15 gnl/TRDRNA2_/TRDRNA2_189751_c0_seq1:63-641(-)
MSGTEVHSRHVHRPDLRSPCTFIDAGGRHKKKMFRDSPEMLLEIELAHECYLREKHKTWERESRMMKTTACEVDASLRKEDRAKAKTGSASQERLLPTLGHMLSRFSFVKSPSRKRDPGQAVGQFDFREPVAKSRPVQYRRLKRSMSETAVEKAILPGDSEKLVGVQLRSTSGLTAGKAVKVAQKNIAQKRQ